LMVNCAGEPGWTLCVGAGALTVNPGDVTPVPLRVEVWGEPLALSATETLAVNAPPASGVNVTEMTQDPAAASVVPQLLVWAKSVGLAPVSVMPEIVSAALPGFESVTVARAEVDPTLVLAKMTEVGESTACGAAATVPVPLRVATCGEPVALSATETDALKVVAEAGVKVTEMVQVAAAARVLPHVVVSAKSVGLAPVMVMPVMVRVALPGFERVIVCAAEVVPVVLVKVSAVGESTA